MLSKRWYFKMGAKHKMCKGKHTFFLVRWVVGMPPFGWGFPASLVVVWTFSSMSTVLSWRTEPRGSGAFVFGGSLASQRRFNWINCVGKYRLCRMTWARTSCLGPSRRLALSLHSQFTALARGDSHTH
jgi:hypothetical protein